MKRTFLCTLVLILATAAAFADSSRLPDDTEFKTSFEYRLRGYRLRSPQ